MKNTLIMAGLAAGLIVAPLSLASAHYAKFHGVTTVSVKCDPTFKPNHRVMFLVLPTRHSYVTVGKVGCGKTKTFKF